MKSKPQLLWKVSDLLLLFLEELGEYCHCRIYLSCVTLPPVCHIIALFLFCLISVIFSYFFFPFLKIFFFFAEEGTLSSYHKLLAIRCHWQENSQTKHQTFIFSFALTLLSHHKWYLPCVYIDVRCASKIFSFSKTHFLFGVCEWNWSFREVDVE